MTKQNPESVTTQITKKSRVVIEIDRTPKGEWKALGGGDRDQWNERLSRLVVSALPVDRKNAKAVVDAGSAVMAGVVDMKPDDPIEGVLIAQIAVANEAALEFYRRGWANTAAGYFDAGTKYLQLADKSSRTVALLTERLDHHRGRGQQQITVKRVTVNADQAVVTDQIVSGKGETNGTKLLTAGTDKPMDIIEPKQNEAVPVEGGGVEGEMSNNPMHKAHAAPRCTARSKRTGQPCRSPAVRGWKVCRMHGARGGAPEGKRNGNYRHGGRTKEMIELWRFIKSLR